MSVSYQIERLLIFGLKKNLIHPNDVTTTRNSLLDLLRISEPYSFADNETIDENLATAGDILSHILDYCAEKGIIPDNTVTQRDLMDAKIMGALMPRSSEVNSEFNKKYSEDKEAATDYFYKLSQDSNYIQTDRIKKNIYWKTSTDFGDLEITINLSKPEKDPKEIAAAKSAPQTNYPKCLLCRENEGFSGHANHPARQNLRLVELGLNGEQWFMQYSPYVYYNEHCIILHKNHVPMKITVDTFRRLLDFIEILPHYMIGSNTDIPIVGGSILTHDHYQGGRHIFPMEIAEETAKYSHEDYKDINISIIKWPLSVIRISGNNKDDLIALSVYILEKWKEYSDESAEILAYTGETPHNAITPIARKNKDGLFELDLVLRNNRTSSEHPLGIFHPHADLHHIKKENIGLIEVMGLAVLPGRLSAELNDISAILCGLTAYNAEEINNPESGLNKHADWIKELIEKYGVNVSKETADGIIQNEVGQIFSRVLQDAGVFKFTETGKSQFDKFMRYCLFSKA